MPITRNAAFGKGDDLDLFAGSRNHESLDGLHVGSFVAWGVLDLDSHEVGSFGEDDVAGLVQVLRAAGLTA